MRASPQAGIFAEGSQFYLALEYPCMAAVEQRAALPRAGEAGALRCYSKRMFGISGDGAHERLLNFTRAVTGSCWCAPSNEAPE